MPRRKTIAVVGPNEADDETRAIAYSVGKFVAERGDVVVTGGLGGVMAATSRGAHDAGGLVVGLLPGSDASAANDAVDAAIPTGLGELRNALVVRAADGVIAVGGSWGTLSEVALAMRTNVPVVCVNGWKISDHKGDDVTLASAKSAAEAIDVLYHAMNDDPMNA